MISVSGGSQYEQWIVVHDDGRIILHTENDGCAFLRHGAKPTEEALTLEQVAALDTGYPPRDLVRRVRAALDGRSYTALAP